MSDDRLLKENIYPQDMDEWIRADEESRAMLPKEEDSDDATLLLPTEAANTEKKDCRLNAAGFRLPNIANGDGNVGESTASDMDEGE